MKRYCLTLDLKNDPALIIAYEEHHKAAWPEITESIKGSGITDMQIYRFKTRLFMIMDAVDDFSFERKAEMDAGNPRVQEWEELMLAYQQPFKNSPQKWVLMDKIFQL